MPAQLALGWSVLPFHGSAFSISQLTGTFGPTELLVFTQVCTRYLARRPADVRVHLSLGDVARWSGSATVGGSQRRLAVATLTRLRAATFTSLLRFGRKGSERHLRGWGLIDEWSSRSPGRPSCAPGRACSQDQAIAWVLIAVTCSVRVIAVDTTPGEREAGTDYAPCRWRDPGGPRHHVIAAS